jgi:tetratricopeptide (TPR) repeat protein
LRADLPRWQRVSTLLQEALSLPEDQRSRWLAELGSDQLEVVPLLRALLARGAAENDTFMSRPVASLWAHALHTDAATDAPGQSIGPYRLIRELGTGGMGTVWLAERFDFAPQRQVAVKLPLHGWAPSVAQRLEQERDTLAALEHPNIARLYDAGATHSGRPYIAMEFVDGLSIDVFAAEHNLSVRARIELVLQVARAVAYAHGRCIVHRDLKPSNILVTRQGEVRLLDFGAAKLLSDDTAQNSALTREAGRALSPDYASPEQIHGEAVTVASDVYSLGVVLFELLTGRRPYKLQRHSAAALQAAIAEAQVPLPSSTATHDQKLRRELRGDLDNIVAKALDKSPLRRYGTINGLAEDLQRWLDHEPVGARPDSVTYRIAKFVRRHRVLVAAGVLVFTALTAAAAVTTAEMFEARRQRDEARAQEKRAQAEERFANMVMEQSGPEGRPLTREQMLDRSVELLDQQYGNDPRFIANALIRISGRYMDLGNTTKELAVLQKAESIARRLADPVLLITAQCNTVETELAAGRLDRAQQRMSEARALLARTPKTPLDRRIVCVHAEATLADARGDTATAVERIETAIALQERGDRTDLTYRALLSHAQALYIHAGRPKDAYAVVEKTLAVLDATDVKNDEARSGAIHNQSVALSQMGEMRAALEQEGSVIAQSSGDDKSRPVEAVVATVFGRLLTRLNRAPQARMWEERAVAAARAGGNVGAQVFALTALAETQVYAGHLEHAAKSADEAARLLTPTSDPRERAAVQRARALVALQRTDLPSAQAAAAAMLDTIAYPDMRKARSAQFADVYLLLAARIALKAGQAAYAARLSSDGLGLASELARDPEKSATVGEARLLLARAWSAQGQPAAARAAIHGAARALSAGLSADHPLALEAAALEARL